MKKALRLFVVSMLVCASITSFAKDKKKKKENLREFTPVISLETTSVKDQNRTGTCWDFSAVSFIESELIRMGKGEHDISEMFSVRYAYPAKARKYLMLHGKYQFAQGGQAHDVTDVIRKYGMVPESVYAGLNYGKEKHEHGEMDAVLRSMMKAVVDGRRRNITEVWHKAFDAVLDVYLGEVPETFEYEGKTYTPITFRDAMGFNPDDYVELTSYSYYPFYEKCQLEVPDNWSMAYYYNLPIDDLMKVMHYAMENGFTIEWDGDVSDTYFSHKNGVAFVPVKGWKKDMKISKDDFIKQLHEEKNISQEDRDKAFFSFDTTDDHLMHLTGIVKDQKDVKYFVTKNSWDTDSNEFGGYLNMSEQFLRLRTVAIMVHKDAIPADLKAKLNIK